jgi:CheY-like chemotaxis protein
MPQVLVIDDSTALLPLLEEALLEQPDSSLVHATSGREAFERLDLFAPDVILLSDTLVGSELLDLCERMATEPGTAHVPKCLLTSPGAKGPSDRLSGLVHRVASRPASALEMRAVLDTALSEEISDETSAGGAGEASETRLAVPRRPEPRNGRGTPFSSSSEVS